MKIREIIKKWLGVEGDIQQAVKKEREKADSEKRRITNENDELWRWLSPMRELIDFEEEGVK